MATNRTLPPSGKIMLFKEIISGDKTILNGKSINITGRLITHDLVNCSAVIESVGGGKTMAQSTKAAAQLNTDLNKPAQLDTDLIKPAQLDTDLIKPIQGPSTGHMMVTDEPTKEQPTWLDANTGLIEPAQGSATDPNMAMNKSTKTANRLDIDTGLVEPLQGSATTPSMAMDQSTHAATPLVERLEIDTRLIEPIEGASIGSIYQFIGELGFSEDGSRFLLNARVVFCVDGINIDWYFRALELQREYFRERAAKIPSQASHCSEH